MPEPAQTACDRWLALIIGNTRLHWGLFCHHTLQGVWHTPHLTAAIVQSLITTQFSATTWAAQGISVVEDGGSALWSRLCPLGEWPIPLYVASVVPSQAALWSDYTGFHKIQLRDLPLANLYPTLGIDRALNLLAAGDRYGWPVLVIDAGTALTFTAGAASALVGGAILPGLGLQFKALTEQTATLPPAETTAPLPPRWARTTPTAIQSGIGYGVIAILKDFMADWQHHYPEASLILTGGDGAQLWEWLGDRDRPPALHYVPDLMFWGVKCYRQAALATDR